MKITINSTTKIVEVKSGSLDSGIPARIWEGQTESGIGVHCFITRIAAAAEADQTTFQAELQECKPPTADVEKYPLRMILA